MTDRKISVIVPIYNAEEYIRECVESLRKQDYPNFEVILVDDGSQDAGIALVEELIRNDRRFSLVHKENGGLSDARNYGMSLAKGEYFSFVDADDYVSEHYLSCLAELVSEEVPLAILGYYLDDCAVLSRNLHRKEDYREVISSQQAIRILDDATDNKRISFVVAWGKLYHRRLFQGLSFRKGKLHEDEFINYRLFLAAGKIAYRNRAHYYYRFHKTGISHKCSATSSLHLTEAYRERVAFLEKEGIDSRFARYNYAVWLFIHYRRSKDVQYRRYFFENYGTVAAVGIKKRIKLWYMNLALRIRS